jgi:hypothetical protein
LKSCPCSKAFYDEILGSSQKTGGSDTHWVATSEPFPH